MLGARLADDGYYVATAVLLILGGAAWLLLSYGIPVSLLTWHGSRSALESVSGNWFLWTVGTQSIALAIASLARPVPSSLAALAVLLWAVGGCDRVRTLGGSPVSGDDHSVHSASVGDSRAALSAGSRPANAPMSSAAASPPAQAWAGMTTAQPLVCA